MILKFANLERVHILKIVSFVFSALEYQQAVKALLVQCQLNGEMKEIDATTNVKYLKKHLSGIFGKTKHNPQRLKSAKSQKYNFKDL